MLYMVGIGKKLDRGDAIKNLRNPEFGGLVYKFFTIVITVACTVCVTNLKKRTDALANVVVAMVVGYTAI